MKQNILPAFLDDTAKRLRTRGGKNSQNLVYLLYLCSKESWLAFLYTWVCCMKCPPAPREIQQLYSAFGSIQSRSSVNIYWIKCPSRLVQTYLRLTSMPKGLPWQLSWYRIRLQWRGPQLCPWIGKIPWKREWLPTPGFLPGEFHGRRSLASYSPWGHKE